MHHQALYTRITSSLWHQRLDHPHQASLQVISTTHLQLQMPVSSLFCNSCKASKSHKLPFPISNSKSSSLFELVHSDVWGPAPISSQGFTYFVLFIGDYSRYTWIFPMFTKSEAIHKFKQFHMLVKTQFNQNIKILRTDGGDEYTSTEFTQYLNSHGILHQLTCSYTPQQNDVEERKHRHLIETTRTLLTTTNINHSFWIYALTTAIHLINRTPSRTLNMKTPQYILHNKHPSYNHLRVFGCSCFPWQKYNSPNKLSPRAPHCVFLRPPTKVTTV
ncbi:hypothetical protein KFK09_017881 [Dendrobium nobile]|uniref:Integrase catalytic domain-containing protein n=1 Tax=Dendrobium nobile TaxID=94219 RepID=A0A8T3AT93_DENNO|nr:hypothetical protein KFK09_017881 [Dendrobium nobile]